MRQNPNAKRSRGRGGRKGGNPRSQVYDSNGPSARVRGNAMQVYEKYQQLARDAASSGDRIAAENLLQHAEHYYRLMVASGQRIGESRDANGRDFEGGRDGGERRAEDGERVNGEDGQPQGAEAPAADREADAADSGAAVAEDAGPDEQPQRRPRRGRRANGNGEDAPAASGGDDEPVAARPQRTRRPRKANGSEAASEGEGGDAVVGEVTQA